MTIIGRYIIQPEVFGHLADAEAGQRRRDPADRRARQADRRRARPFTGCASTAGASIAATSSAFSKPTSRSGCSIPSSGPGLRKISRRPTSDRNDRCRIDFDPTILREYDIRGIVGKTLSAADARALGRAFARYPRPRPGGRRVAVGYDGRLTSPELEAALVEGLARRAASMSCGSAAGRPRCCISPRRRSAVDGGLMVTGSHNPPDHNGFKMVLRRQVVFRRRRSRSSAKRRRALGAPAGAARPGRRAQRVRDDYVARLAQDYRRRRGR